MWRWLYSWLNKSLPDTVGTGTLVLDFNRLISLLVQDWAFGAALGVIPLNMPESVLVRFSEKCNGITLRDLVNTIPYAAIQKGLLTVEKKIKYFLGDV